SPFVTDVATSAMLRTCIVSEFAMAFTLSVSPFHVPATPGTSAWPPSLPSVPTSRATRVTSSAKIRRRSTMLLMVFLSSSTSPCTSTEIFWDRSPLATAVITNATLRTWLVRLLAMQLTLSVRSFHVPPATAAFRAHLARHARHLVGERAELLHHRVDGLLELEHLAAHVHRDLLRQVAVGDGRGHERHVAHLVGQVARHEVHVVGQVLPRAAH